MKPDTKYVKRLLEERRAETASPITRMEWEEVKRVVEYAEKCIELHKQIDKLVDNVISEIEDIEQEDCTPAVYNSLCRAEYLLADIQDLLAEVRV